MKEIKYKINKETIEVPPKQVNANVKEVILK